MRYRLLNVDPNEGIKLTVWYSRPNRLDVFVDGVFKIATNARIDGEGRYIITMPKGMIGLLYKSCFCLKKNNVFVSRSFFQYNA